MTFALSATVGIIVAVGVYLLLGRDLFRMAFGLYMISNALNLLILSVAHLPYGSAPLADLPQPYTDPLVQAMVLTAIVIGFGLSTFFLFLSARIARSRKSLESSSIREWKH